MLGSTKKGPDIAKGTHVLRKTSFNRLRATIIRGRLVRPIEKLLDIMLSISSRSPSSWIDYIKLVTLLRCEFFEAQTTLTDTLIVFLLQPPFNSSTSVDNLRSGNFHLRKTMRMWVNKSNLYLLNLNLYKTFVLQVCSV